MELCKALQSTHVDYHRPTHPIPSHSSLIIFRFKSSPHHVLLPLPSTPPTTSGTPTDYAARHRHADSLRHSFSPDCRLWDLVGLALQRQVVVFPARVVPYDSPSYGPFVHPSMANTLPARNVPSQHTSEPLLPTHHYHASPEGRYLTNTILHHTFGQSARNRCPYLSSTAQQSGWILDTLGRR